ncbi:MAG: hypothetical protein ACPG4N_12095 [Gammaproteobacteria bacterium]
MQLSRWFRLAVLLTLLLGASSAPAVAETGLGGKAKVEQQAGTLAFFSDSSAGEVSAYLQSELQSRGFQVQFVQPIDKGLTAHGDHQPYFRVIIFNPPAEDIPKGEAGDALHAFLPLRIAVAETAEGTRASVLPYARLAESLEPEAAEALRTWAHQLEQTLAEMF